jgi:hypothetical protein
MAVSLKDYLRYKGRLRIVLGLLVAFVALASARSAAAELRLSLETPKGEYVLGEPVTVRLTLSNPSGKPEKTIAILDPRFGDLVFQISGDGKTYKYYFGPGWQVVDYIAKPRVIKPGERMEFEVQILWNKTIAGVKDHIATEFAFPRPGHYWLRAFLQDIDIAHRSNTIEVDIVPPEKKDVAIWEVLQKNPRLARFIQAPASPIDPTELKELEALAREHPKSTYTPHIRKALKSRTRMLKK